MNEEKTWKTVLENLKITLSSASFSTWFPQTHIVRFKKIDSKRQITEIGCPSTFVSQNVENRYYGLIKEALDQVTEKKNDLVFLVKPVNKIKTLAGPLFDTSPEEKPGIPEALEQAGLRTDFNFDSFAVSSTNQIAHAAAQAVAQTPGKAYNPLFLYGGVGVGKTHLMQAIGHVVLNRNPRTKIVYCTSEEFTNEIVDAIRKKTTDEFKKRYRTVRILLVDDIQFIAGKEKAQEEFFHTFNAILKGGGQVVLTSDRPPQEINKLEQRLRSRFEGGLNIDIQPPDFELRTAILLIKAQQKKFKLPMDIAQLMASNITSIRRLEGFLTRVMGEIQARKVPLTLELVSALLGDLPSLETTHKLVRPKEILSAAATFYNLKLADLTGDSRLKLIAQARQIVMYLLRTELKLPLTQIGALLGDRDHTTIIHGVGKITQLLPESENLRVEMVGIRKKIYG